MSLELLKRLRPGAAVFRRIILHLRLTHYAADMWSASTYGYVDWNVSDSAVQLPMSLSSIVTIVEAPLATNAFMHLEDALASCVMRHTLINYRPCVLSLNSPSFCLR